MEVGQSINSYLVDGPNVLVDKSRCPISPMVSPASYGNMARDGGNLLIEPDQYDEAMADPVAQNTFTVL